MAVLIEPKPKVEDKTHSGTPFEATGRRTYGVGVGVESGIEEPEGLGRKQIIKKIVNRV